MASVYLKIRAGVGQLNEEFISGRIKSILDQNGAPDAEISGSMMMDYNITNIPDDVAGSVFSRMNSEPGFDPQLYGHV